MSAEEGSEVCLGWVDLNAVSLGSCVARRSWVNLLVKRHTIDFSLNAGSRFEPENYYCDQGAKSAGGGSGEDP